MASSPVLSPCAALVRAHDYDRYLCTLFAGYGVREAWFTLFAFNHEIAAIAESVSEEMIGFMRFAWWREALDEIEAGGVVRRHPVVQALAEIMAQTKLTRAAFDAMLDAREAALANEGFIEAEEWEAYFRATSSSLLILCAEAGGMKDSPELASLGIIWGAIGTARSARQKGDKSNVALLIQLAESHLNDVTEVPADFTAFKDMAAFHLQKLKSGSKAVGNSRVILHLFWRHFIRRIIK